jgi:processive 1,2-diacylglycerol beta-glucosyltransferase/1,2-diacylglycerol 3-beta-galactosyltransferase
MSNTKKTYLFLYLRTGGGHLAPARSVANYLTEQHGETIEPVLIDGLAEAKAFARYIIEDGYRMLQAKAKWYYEFLYATNKFAPIGWFNVFMANLYIKPYIRRMIVQHRPAKIVVIHFFLITPVYQVLKELGLDIPVVTVVTDPFTAHPLWFQRKAQQYIVFSERLKRHCVKRGIPESSIRVFPFIIDGKFASPLPPERIAVERTRFGLDASKKTILIIGGGDGIPHGKRILQHLLMAEIPARISIVCGKNKELYAEAMELQKQYPQLLVFGFVDFVYELLNVSDIVITKCGASTIMEILMMQKVPVIIDYLWEQELGNMEFVRNNQLGIFERNISKLPGIVRELCTDPLRYELFRKNIERIGLKNGTKEVGEYLLRGNEGK